MPVEYIGLLITVVGCGFGVLLIFYGGFLYFNKNKFMTVKAMRVTAFGILSMMVCIPFAIPNHFLANSTLDVNLIEGITLSLFLGSPLIIMGVTVYIALNEKAQQIYDSISNKEKLLYYTELLNKKLLDKH